MADNVIGKSGPAGAQRIPPAQDVLPLSKEVRANIVKTKATCPFIGTAIASGQLPVRSDALLPLASIDDVVKLGNSGGGDLGRVLEVFAEGNHAFTRGASGKLDQPVRT